MECAALERRQGADDRGIGRSSGSRCLLHCPAGAGQVNVGIVMLAPLAKPLEAKLADFTTEPEVGAKPPKPLKAGRKDRR